MDKIKSFFRWIKSNLSYIAKRASAFTSSFIAIVGLIDSLCSLDLGFPDDWGFVKRLLVCILLICAIWVVSAIAAGVVVFVTKQVEVINAGNGHHVYVEYGDLLKEQEERCNVVVTANRCFDTLVDEDLISSTTIHGQAVQKICTGGFTAQDLNEALQADLRDNRQVQPETTLTPTDKRAGNLKRYPVGTVAEFRKNDSDMATYFFLGMSAFDSALHPETTDEEYVLTIQRLLEYCKTRSQRQPVYMPVIGTNGRDNPKDERELLEYMVNTFRFHKHLINTDIHIVVYSKRQSEVPITGL